MSGYITNTSNISSIEYTLTTSIYLNIEMLLLHIT